VVLAVKLACRVSEELQVLGVRPRHTRHVGDALARALEQLVSQARIDVAPRGCRGAHGRHAVAGERALELVAADLDEVIDIGLRHELVEINDPRVSREHARPQVRESLDELAEGGIDRPGDSGGLHRWVAVARLLVVDAAQFARVPACPEHESLVGHAFARRCPRRARLVCVVAA